MRETGVRVAARADVVAAARLGAFEVDGKDATTPPLRWIRYHTTIVTDTSEPQDLTQGLHEEGLPGGKRRKVECGGRGLHKGRTRCEERSAPGNCERRGGAGEGIPSVENRGGRRGGGTDIQGRDARSRVSRRGF